MSCSHNVWDDGQKVCDVGRGDPCWLTKKDGFCPFETAGDEDARKSEEARMREIIQHEAAEATYTGGRR